jgi:tetratricopeptide (TPR) repeat protein
MIENAVEKHYKADAILHSIHKTRDILSAINCIGLAECKRAFGEYESTLELYANALSIKESIMSENHLDIAAIHNDIAVVLSDSGRFNEALNQFQKSLSIRESLCVPNISFVSAYMDIGKTFHRIKDLEKALEWNLMALQILDSHYATKINAEYGALYNNIGEIYREGNQFSRAMNHYEQSLSVREALYGYKHPLVAETICNIGKLYRDSGEKKQALNKFQECLAVQLEMLPGISPDIALTYNEMAGIERDMGDLPKALDYYKLAVSIYEKSGGESNPDTATAYNNISIVYQKLREYSLALEASEKAIAVFEKVFGEKHVNVALAYVNYASNSHASGKLINARIYYERAFSILKCWGERYQHLIDRIDRALNELAKEIELNGDVIGGPNEI